MSKYPGAGKKIAFNWESAFKVSERELVNPKLSFWDKRDLYDLLLKDLREFVNNAQMQPYCNLNDTQFEEEIEKIFPKYMMYDTYNINHTPTKNIEMGETDENNQWLFDFLMNKSTGYYTKTVTQQNPFNSFVYSSEIIRQLLELYQQENPEGPGSNDGEDGNGEGKSGMQKMLESMLNNGKGNQKLDKAMDQAQKNADDRIKDSGKAGQVTGELGASKDMGDFSLGDLKEFLDYMESVKHIVLSENLISSFIKTTLKLSQTYFSTRYTEKSIDFMEADVIDDLQGLEFLVPSLKALGIDDVSTHERVYHMKFDVYIDISGSMDSNIYGYTDGGKNHVSIKGLDLAKITAIKLRNMGFVEDIYPFENQVHPKLDSNMDVALIRCTGGTSIDRVVQAVIKTDKPSVVITDMCDHISLYDPNVYFIGILGANFESFRHTATGKAYIESKQCVQYDGNKGFNLVT